MSERELKIKDKIVIQNYNTEGVDEVFVVKNFVEKNNETHMIVVSVDNPNYEISLKRETSGLWNLVIPRENVNKDLTIHFLGGDPGLLDALVSPIVGPGYGTGYYPGYYPGYYNGYYRGGLYRR